MHEDLEPIRFNITPNAPDDTFQANVRANLPRRHPRLKVKQCAIVGGGPSLSDNLADLRKFHEFGADIFAINGAVGYLQDNFVPVDSGIIYDSRPENAAFIRDGVHWLIASHAHPSVFEAAKHCDVTMFHSSGAAGVQEIIRKAEPLATILEGTSTGGLQALSIVTMMGYKVARLYGYDSSARGVEKHAYEQDLNADQALIDIHFNGKVYPSSAVMAEQAKLFSETYPFYEGAGLSIEVVGDGLLPDMWRYQEANKQPITGATLEELEAKKYAHIWEKDTYRRYSPAEVLLPDFLEAMTPEPGARIIDFGTGTGRAAAQLVAQGFDVLGVDHAPNCLDVGVTIPLCIATLWQLPEGVKGALGLCADVMEHIPPQHVDEVLRRISAAVEIGCFFNISFQPDRFGDRRTGPLHLTVQPAEWWLERLCEHFGVVHPIGGGIFACFN